MPEAEISIVNVVATAALDHTIDLDGITKSFPRAEYRPEQFPGLVFRIKKPKTATLIFHSGKMVCTGAKSSAQAVKAVDKVVKELKSHGIIIIGRPKTQVQNIVASASLGGKVDLEKVTYQLEKTIYEPEQFPGLIYRMDQPKVVILIFSTGKLVVTGAKKEQEVYEAVNKLQSRLEKEKIIFYEE